METKHRVTQNKKWDHRNTEYMNITRMTSGHEKVKRKIITGCPYVTKCGGCDRTDDDYQAHLKRKQGMVEQKLQSVCKVMPIVGMEHPYHYRNKVHAVYAHTKQGIISGVYEEGTHHVVAVEHCGIEDEKADAIIQSIKELAKSFKLKIFNEDTGYGWLRHVLIRRGFASGEILVVLVAASPVFPSKKNFISALLKLHPEITSIVLNINQRKTSMVLGEREIVLYGKGYIQDTLCGMQFRISPKSFYQVNPVQTQYLYQKAIELAQLTGTERIIDAYCGIGTIGLIAGPQAGEVIGIELNADAVADAKINAGVNGVSNAEFYQGDAGKFMVRMARQGEKADVVFMDPPRAGSDEAFLSSVITLGPKRIVYISCNPETLARDVKYLMKRGYQIGEAYPFDMFPWSNKHAEVVTVLTRKEK